MFDPGTQVSLTNPTIKKVVGSVEPGYRGKRIKVVQVKPTFEYQYINDSGEPYVYVARPGGSGLREIARPGYGSSHTVRFMEGQGMIVTREIGSSGPRYRGAITIYVPTLDPNTMDVARDAALEERSKTEISNILHPALGDYAGIAEAVLESEVKTLGKAAKAPRSKGAGTKLDREIDSFLLRSRWVARRSGRT